MPLSKRKQRFRDPIRSGRRKPTGPVKTPEELLERRHGSIRLAIFGESAGRSEIRRSLANPTGAGPHEGPSGRCGGASPSEEPPDHRPSPTRGLDRTRWTIPRAARIGSPGVGSSPSGGDSGRGRLDVDGHRWSIQARIGEDAIRFVSGFHPRAGCATGVGRSVGISWPEDLRRLEAPRS